jgi:hypothetical protein
MGTDYYTHLIVGVPFNAPLCKFGRKEVEVKLFSQITGKPDNYFTGKDIVTFNGIDYELDYGRAPKTLKRAVKDLTGLDLIDNCGSFFIGIKVGKTVYGGRAHGVESTENEIQTAFANARIGLKRLGINESDVKLHCDIEVSC